MKKLYNKIAPVVSKISLAGLILAVLALLGAKFYLNNQNSILWLPKSFWERLVVRRHTIGTSNLVWHYQMLPNSGTVKNL